MSASISAPAVRSVRRKPVKATSKACKKAGSPVAAFPINPPVLFAKDLPELTETTCFVAVVDKDGKVDRMFPAPDSRFGMAKAYNELVTGKRAIPVDPETALAWLALNEGGVNFVKVHDDCPRGEAVKVWSVLTSATVSYADWEVSAYARTKREAEAVVAEKDVSQDSDKYKVVPSTVVFPGTRFQVFVAKLTSCDFDPGTNRCFTPASLFDMPQQVLHYDNIFSPKGSYPGDHWADQTREEVLRECAENNAEVLKALEKDPLAMWGRRDDELYWSIPIELGCRHKQSQWAEVCFDLRNGIGQTTERLRRPIRIVVPTKAEIEAYGRASAHMAEP